MKASNLAVLACVWMAAPIILPAQQQWEIGFIGGGSIWRNAEITGPKGTAGAGAEPGFVAGAYLGHELYSWIGGEVRYVFEQSNFKLDSGGTTASLGGQSHIVHYDLLFHTGDREARIRAFGAVGGGMKIYRGTGKDVAYQPLNTFAYLTRTQQTLGLISVGGGVKIRIGSKTQIRAELRDYFTPFPKEVIAPAPGYKANGWLHNFVPMVAIAFTL